jgi:hypothetical protein
MKKLLVFLFASLVFTCCDKAENADAPAKSDEVSEDMVRFSPPSSGLIAGLATPGAGNDRTESTVSDNAKSIKIPEKIKKTADINITVEDYYKSRAEVEKVVKAGNAYISSENESKSTYSISNTIVIRVLNKDFDAMVDNVTGIARHVNSKNISTEDVTAQFIDITARLKTKREVEKRYFEILQKANKITDILEVEEKIRIIQEEIEAKEGELKYLNDQVDYSTINLNMHQDFEYTPVGEPGFFGRLGHAFGNGWKGFLGFIVGLVYVWPLWLVLGIIAYFLVKFIKKQMRKK